jgi:hypothetical protein
MQGRRSTDMPERANPAHGVTPENSFVTFIRKVEAEHPQYQKELALARQVAELQRQTDEVNRRQPPQPVVTYAVNL